MPTSFEDLTFMETFIQTYRSFASPREFFEKLKERYNVPTSYEISQAKLIKLRVSIVMKYWIENQNRDITSDLISDMKDFFRDEFLKDGFSEVSPLYLQPRSAFS